MSIDIKLYGNSASPYVRHCQIALIECGMGYEFVQTDAGLSAKLSPMQKIPFFEYSEDGQIKMLTDSTSILRYTREKSGQIFLATVEELNDYCSVNTLIDAQLNLFLLKIEGVNSENVSYLKRQENRIKTGLKEFEVMSFSEQAPWSDAELRLACFLAWVRFRKHFSLKPYPNLNNLLDRLDIYPPFIETAIVDS
ncbi:MAG: glutathione S-transferase family protein [Gammaproteobacteria bacterium]|jgi:glutathione S-transferase|nr:glutathione S-transferase family protein [Gammaproteobacteria bacterium]